MIYFIIFQADAVMADGTRLNGKFTTANGEFQAVQQKIEALVGDKWQEIVPEDDDTAVANLTRNRDYVPMAVLRKAARPARRPPRKQLLLFRHKHSGDLIWHHTADEAAAYYERVKGVVTEKQHVERFETDEPRIYP